MNTRAIVRMMEAVLSGAGGVSYFHHTGSRYHLGRAGVKKIGLHSNRVEKEEFEGEKRVSGEISQANQGVYYLFYRRLSKLFGATGWIVTMDDDHAIYPLTN